MDRSPHLLTPNKRKFRPALHIFFDAESWVDDYIDNWAGHHFRLGWALFWRRGKGERKDQLEWYRIESLREFWLWVEKHTRSKTRLLLISHNLNYDLFMTKAFRMLPEMGWELSRFYSQPSCSIFSWRKDGRTLQCVDNVNWFKGKLKSWGEIVGYPKLEVDHQDKRDELVSDYCRRDVEILYHLWEWWYSFCNEHDLGTWGITLPSQAFLAYRHRFMGHKIYIHNDPEITKLERWSYHGGRTECFQVGVFEGGPFYKLDVNSMYPWAMWSFKYPTSFRGHSSHLSLKALRYYLTKYLVIARVKVWVDEPYFPIYKDMHIAYPVGQFETILSSPELKIALEHGWIEEVREAVWYTKGLIFRDYVDYFYRLKDKYNREGNWVCYRLTKLMLNSLYGKFGQLATDMKEIGVCDPGIFRVSRDFNARLGKWATEYYIGGKIFRGVSAGEAYHSFPAIAAHVTANARVYLYKLIEAVGRENVYYCDTDSVIVNQVGYDRFEPFIRPHELGNLKVEAVTNYLSIRASKDYTLGDEERIKGVKKDAVWLDDRTVEMEIFPSIRGLLQSGETETYKTKKVIKVLKRRIHSGEVTEGGVVVPWNVSSLL